MSGSDRKQNILNWLSVKTILKVALECFLMLDVFEKKVMLL